MGSPEGEPGRKASGGKLREGNPGRGIPAGRREKFRVEAWKRKSGEESVAAEQQIYNNRFITTDL